MNTEPENDSASRGRTMLEAMMAEPPSPREMRRRALAAVAVAQTSLTELPSLESSLASERLEQTRYVPSSSLLELVRTPKGIESRPTDSFRLKSLDGLLLIAKAVDPRPLDALPSSSETDRPLAYPGQKIPPPLLPMPQFPRAAFARTAVRAVSRDVPADQLDGFPDAEIVDDGWDPDPSKPEAERLADRSVRELPVANTAPVAEVGPVVVEQAVAAGGGAEARSEAPAVRQPPFQPGESWILTVESQPHGRSKVRSEKTERAYDVDVRRLYEQAAQQHSPETIWYGDVDPVKVAEYLIWQRTGPWSDLYWNGLRSALLYHLDVGRRVGLTKKVFEEAFSILKVVRNRKGRQRRGGARTKKTLPMKDLEVILDELETMNRHVGWGRRAAAFLMAGLHSGARPCEWAHARWIPAGNEIELKNGKRKTGQAVFTIEDIKGRTVHEVEADNPESIRAGGKSDESKKYRYVPIDDVGGSWISEHLQNVEGFLARVPEGDRDAEMSKYSKACRKAILNACNSLFHGKKRYSLYNARSQFSANMKSRMPLSGVQAVMGHDEGSSTTKSSYAGARAAHDRVTPTPAEREQRAINRKDAAINQARSKGVPRERD